MADSIWVNVASACSKKPYTILRLKSLSSSSSISRICSKVPTSRYSYSERINRLFLGWKSDHVS